MRRRWINAIAVANACTLGAGILVIATTPARTLAAADAPGRTRPNIVVFMTDDQTVEDMRVLVRTNELLTERGVTFANSFVSFPLCCPARATYLTGQYAHNHMVLFNDPPYGYLSARGTETLPALLQGQGYRTVHVGKYFNLYGRDDPTEVPTGWSSFHASVGKGIHWYHGYTMNHNGTVARYGVPEDPNPSTYFTDVTRDIALDEIESAARDEEPLFLSMMFLAPHGENAYPGQRRPVDNPRGAPRHQQLYPTRKAPRTPSFNERVVGDKPKAIQKLPRLQEWGKGFVDQLHRARLRSLRSVDEAVAKIVRRLDSLGELEHTWFFFTSDNGFFQGQHRLRWGKYLPYEPSIRVPLVIAGPDVPAGAVSEQLVSNVDLAPTILDIAGSPADAASMDGRSLAPFIRRPGDVVDRILLFESGPSPTSGKDLSVIEATLGRTRDITKLYQAVRTDRYKYVEYHHGEIELYDLLVDPYERRSVHEDPSFTPLLPLLRAALDLLRDCEGEACRLAELRTLGASLS